MKFEKITYDGLDKHIEIVEFDNLESLKNMLNQVFMLDPNAARYEELKMQNGKTAVSLKDRCNKLIIQYKTT